MCNNFWNINMYKMEEILETGISDWFFKSTNILLKLSMYFILKKCLFSIIIIIICILQFIFWCMLNSTPYYLQIYLSAKLLIDVSFFLFSLHVSCKHLNQYADYTCKITYVNFICNLFIKKIALHKYISQRKLEYFYYVGYSIL